MPLKVKMKMDYRIYISESLLSLKQWSYKL